MAPGAPTEVAGPDADQSGRTTATPWRIRNAAERPILSSPRAIVGSLFSFEALLVLYMFAGIYKGDPRFAWVPVDPTGLFFALSVVVGSFIVVLNPIPKRAFPVIWVMLAFVVWWAVTLTWSPSKVYGPSKVFFMATLELWALTAAALIVGPNPERVRRLFTLLLLFASWLGIEALQIYREDKQGFIMVGSASYVALGRVVGLGALVAFTAWLFGRRLSVVKLLFLALFVGLAFVLMIAGGRGPLISILVPILLTLLLGLQVTGRRILYRRYGISIVVLASGLIAGLSIYIATTGQMPRSLARLESMVVGGEIRGSAENRIERYGEVPGFWYHAPLLGNGAGSWPILTGRSDERSYPHNILLEVLVESGVVGLILLVVLLHVALRPVSLERVSNDPLASCAFMMFVNAFMNAMVSGDLADNRTLFMLLGLLTVFTVKRGTPRRAVQPSLALSLTRQPREGVGSLRSPGLK
jgi:O-antigen ligase